MNLPKSADRSRAATEMRRIHVDDQGAYPCSTLRSICLLGVVMAKAPEAAKGRRGLCGGHENGQVNGKGSSPFR